jgi:hypothetical protein
MQLPHVAPVIALLANLAVFSFGMAGKQEAGHAVTSIYTVLEDRPLCFHSAYGTLSIPSINWHIEVVAVYLGTVGARSMRCERVSYV